MRFALAEIGLKLIRSGILKFESHCPDLSGIFVDKAQEDQVQVVETYWRKPFSVLLQNGLNRTFVSVEDTLDFLENEWPTKVGTHRRRAIDLSRAASNRTAATETAREAVIAACIEAGLPLVNRHQRTEHPESGAVHAV